GRTSARPRRRPRGRRGTAPGQLPRGPGGRDRPAGQADVQPVPGADPDGCARAGHLGADRRPRRRHRRPDGRRRRHVHLRGPRRRHPAARDDAAGGPAAEDHHPRRSRHRAGHRVGLVPQRHAARVGARAGRADRHRRGRHRLPRAASRPLPGLPQLLRDARLRHPAADRAGAGPALGRAAARPLPRPGGPGHGDDLGRRQRQLRGRTGRLPRRGRVSRRRGLLVPGHADQRAGPGEQLHRPGHLLPLDPARPRDPVRPAHHVGLPLAVGHRLVLVLTGVRRSEPAAPALVAATPPAQQLLLAAAGPGAAVRAGRPGRAAPWASAARTGGAGRRAARRAVRRVPALVPRRGPRRAALALPGPAARALAVVPDAARAHVRERRLLGHGAGGAERGEDEPAPRAPGPRAARAQVALLRRLLLRRRVRPALRRRGLPGGQEDLRPGQPLPRPLREGGATTV
ncbi:MAG: FAD/FMN-containing dehydrogenases, partial [uncultured Friedmanniella sp.]